MILLTVGELINLAEKLKNGVDKNTPVKIVADNKHACIKTMDDQVLAWDRRRAPVTAD